MLVVSRKQDEDLVMTVPPSQSETTLYVRIVQIKTRQVRVGVEAPKEVRIMRSELAPGGSQPKRA